MFWLIVPETHIFGSLSVLLALNFVAFARSRIVCPLWDVLISATTLSITVTNWMFGLFAAFTRRPLYAAFQVSVNAFSLIVVVWAFQKHFFPTAYFFLGNPPESASILPAESRGLYHVIGSFFLHTMLMPAIHVVDRPGAGDWPIMITQLAIPGSSAGIFGQVGVFLWVALLTLGLWAWAVLKDHRELRIVLMLGLLGQLALHCVFGGETFLYALNFSPMMFILAGLALLTRFRPLALLCAGALVVIAVPNNSNQLRKAIAFFNHPGITIHRLDDEKLKRPTDPWPSNRELLVMGRRDGVMKDQAVHELGGSVSPGLDTFGISFWIVDSEGKLVVTSHDIPVNQVHQQKSEVSNSTQSVLTETPYWRALWSSGGPHRWRLDLRNKTPKHSGLIVVVRSVGPRVLPEGGGGGPIRLIKWTPMERRVLVNDRWSVLFNHDVTDGCLGEEGPPEWMSRCSDIQTLKSESGWGYARLGLKAGDWVIVVEDTRPEAPVDRLLFVL